MANLYANNTALFSSIKTSKPVQDYYTLLRVGVSSFWETHYTFKKVHESKTKFLTKNFIDLLSSMYNDLGFKDFKIKLSTRPEKRIGSDSSWDKAEKALEDAIETLLGVEIVDEHDHVIDMRKLASAKLQQQNLTK